MSVLQEEPTDHAASLAELTLRIRVSGDPERAVQARRYLKSSLTFWGVDLPSLREEARRLVRTLPPVPRSGATPSQRRARADATLVWVEALWVEPVHELRTLACLLLQSEARRLSAADLPVVERVLRDSHTWAYVDLIAMHVVGRIRRDPAERAAVDAVLDRWIGDPDFWIRRSALLALMLANREGEPDLPKLFDTIERLLPEKEFFLRKVAGWALREIATKHPEEAAAFIVAHKAKMSGLTFREGSRKLPLHLKERVGR